jgi:hypothetical protein
MENDEMLRDTMAKLVPTYNYRRITRPYGMMSHARRRKYN